MTGNPTIIGTMGIPVMTIKPENELPLRHELKHRINLREDLVLSQRLKMCIRDRSCCPSSGGDDILDKASNLPKLHAEASDEDDPMSAQAV